ncbi:hypothetical protein [Metabacillus litoralis]|uniref:hypothetical protein n=1 Tax=Metabacillus litoralis TaxID=152268 RepID=UPI00203CADE8|nr:hypothetical protein [Metabacillus litoralis]MCM3164283.1 hypothetical protein [Metabacillus litoralis]
MNLCSANKAQLYDITGVSTVTYNYPSMYWLIYLILLITLILGIYLILAKEK